MLMQEMCDLDCKQNGTPLQPRHFPNEPFLTICIYSTYLEHYKFTSYVYT